MKDINKAEAGDAVVLMLPTGDDMEYRVISVGEDVTGSKVLTVYVAVAPSYMEDMITTMTIITEGQWDNGYYEIQKSSRVVNDKEKEDYFVGESVKWERLKKYDEVVSDKGIFVVMAPFVDDDNPGFARNESHEKIRFAAGDAFHHIYRPVNDGSRLGINEWVHFRENIPSSMLEAGTHSRNYLLRDIDYCEGVMKLRLDTFMDDGSVKEEVVFYPIDKYELVKGFYPEELPLITKVWCKSIKRAGFIASPYSSSDKSYNVIVPVNEEKRILNILCCGKYHEKEVRRFHISDLIQVK